MDPAHLEAVDVQDGDGEGLLPRVHQLVDAVREPAEEQGVEGLGNGVPGEGAEERSAGAPARHGTARHGAQPRHRGQHPSQPRVVHGAALGAAVLITRRA